MPYIQPPPPPPIITLDDDDDSKEDGECSGEEDTSNHNNNARQAALKAQTVVAVSSSSDIQFVGDELFSFDDSGLNIGDAEEAFQELKKQSFNDGAVLDIALNVTEDSKKTRSGISCFNCLGSHTLSDCPLPINRQKVSKNRSSFGPVRKERISNANRSDRKSKFVPGDLSITALDALDLPKNRYPPWIYRMREAGPLKGYPPGYLKELEGTKTLEFFSDDPHFANAVKSPLSLDKSQIRWYEGFNMVEWSHPAEEALSQYSRNTYRKWTQDEYTKYLEGCINEKRRNEESVNTRKRRHNEESEQALKKARMDVEVADKTDSPASPDNPPVVSRTLTEDEAKPKEFLVPTVDRSKMPKFENFAEGIQPFQYDNLSQSTGLLDKIANIIKNRKKT